MKKKEGNKKRSMEGMTQGRRKNKEGKNKRMIELRKENNTRKIKESTTRERTG